MKIVKACRICNSTRNEYYGNRKVCKKCYLNRVLQRQKVSQKVKEYHRNYMREVYRPNHKLQTWARNQVRDAVKYGRLSKENCWCGESAHAHHEDYNKPLDVVWLCHRHHMEVHHANTSS